MIMPESEKSKVITMPLLKKAYKNNIYHNEQYEMNNMQCDVA